MLVAVALLVVCALGQPLPGLLGVDHVGLVVPNVSLASAFLRDAFDCRFDWEVTRDPKPTSGERGWDKTFAIHPESYMPHVLMLKCGPYHLAQYVELFEWVSPDQVRPQGPDGWLRFSDVGNSYVAFTVANISAVVEHLERVVFPKYPGTRMVQPTPMSFPLRGELCTSFFIVSPWGMWIEISYWEKSTPLHPHLPGRAAAKEQEKVVVFGDEPVVATQKHAAIGKSITLIDTPAVWVDLAAMETNVRLLQSRLKLVQWLPVVKAHKAAGLAQRLVDLGARGVVVLTVSEAEAMSVLRSTEQLVIYIANQVTVPPKLTRLVQLAARNPHLRYRVNVDNAMIAADLNNAAKGAGVVLEVAIELNIGHNRTGVTPQETVALARLILSKTNLRLVGIAGYEGHTPVLAPAEKLAATQRAHAVLREAKTLLEAAGVAVGIVSGGGSSNYPQALEVGVLTELQAGGVALCDKLYLTLAHLEQHGHVPALYVETTVTSVQSHPTRAAADAGFKSVGWHPFAGNPLIIDSDVACVEVSGMSAEHLRMRPKEGCQLNVTMHQRLRVIPGYGDSFLGAQKQIYAVRNCIVEDVWSVHR
jgi:3-hydroxy-D-aspartate aldolase